MGAKKVEIYDLSAKETYTKYIIISSSPNEETSQNFAVALEKLFNWKIFLCLVFQKEGMHKGNWIILDFINFVVHIMIESPKGKNKIRKLMDFIQNNKKVINLIEKIFLTYWQSLKKQKML